MDHSWRRRHGMWSPFFCWVVFEERRFDNIYNLATFKCYVRNFLSVLWSCIECAQVRIFFLLFLLQEDLYYPHPLVQDLLWVSIDKVVEPILMHWPGKRLREKALRVAMEHIHYEDENTRYICIGPVNKVYIKSHWWSFTYFEMFDV